MPRTRIIAGVAIAVVGVVWPWIARLGRLPRDIFVVQERVLVSTLLSLTLWLFSR
jgi:hypothetical protein